MKESIFLAILYLVQTVLYIIRGVIYLKEGKKKSGIMFIVSAIVLGLLLVVFVKL